ncbi:alpha/beta hydrolase [Sphingobacterium psychroaquaticum]|uniref:Lysophospholipase, alpha-beta hydrolase superfamily n=1 Tax=Sphingobacterium psychroaquaticum TaxID=561061 RepID=A0A1X7L2K7_9SPHI|nr:alpha/beta hydrolase [Sphingobacterium psychroaquaticum]QBQ39886.1 alpha/beta hydrolase [Sphingobacterium psychroaquaticum]SMG47877.1 Lysophospholipase, alpha-beta hydrolase superfamily [Sphingobacterium psychroaquaticum]
METETYAFQEDILGYPYEQARLDLPDDYEGSVHAVLVRKKAPLESKKAVLYVHGYIDYFFQTEMADQFNMHGYHFYALDLRKYGRAHLSHQGYYRVRNLKEYDEEINRSLAIMKQEGHDSVILCGHSTGGLVLTYFAARHPNHPLVKGLWCNSPFYDFNVGSLTKTIGIPLVSALATLFPNLPIPNGMNAQYAKSLHQEHKGEWNFDLTWKPLDYTYSDASFIRAVHQAQRYIQQGVHLTVPTLIMHGAQSSFSKKWDKHSQSSDLVLNVRDIARYANKLKGDITILPIENGIHDLVLSKEEVRTQVYLALFAWLRKKEL